MESSLRFLRSNLVQSIRAFTATQLQKTAGEWGHHFLYANLAGTETQQDVLGRLAEQYQLSDHASKGFDTFYSCMTDMIHKSGPQTGFIVVVEHIPTSHKFDRDVRERLIDLLREISEYWADRKVPFRCFYSFAVARSCEQVDSTTFTLEGKSEPMPADKLLDVSPLALRMSSPFNTGYWLQYSSSEDSSSTTAPTA